MVIINDLYGHILHPLMHNVLETERLIVNDYKKQKPGEDQQACIMCILSTNYTGTLTWPHFQLLKWSSKWLKSWLKQSWSVRGYMGGGSSTNYYLILIAFWWWAMVEMKGRKGCGDGVEWEAFAGRKNRVNGEIQTPRPPLGTSSTGPGESFKLWSWWIWRLPWAPPLPLAIISESIIEALILEKGW